MKVHRTVGTRPLNAEINAAYFIRSDLGGVQDEAPALAKFVAVLRNETDRAETIDAGAATFVGMSIDRIMRAFI